MTSTTGRGYATGQTSDDALFTVAGANFDTSSLFPPDSAARYAGTELETPAERAQRTSQPAVIALADHLKVLAFQATQYARYADETAVTCAQREVARALAATKADEDKRADRRNRNRTYTLIVALMFTFLVPFVVANIMHDVGLLKYATGIAIVPDALITLWAYVRKY